MQRDDFEDAVPRREVAQWIVSLASKAEGRTAASIMLLVDRCVAARRLRRPPARARTDHGGRNAAARWSASVLRSGSAWLSRCGCPLTNIGACSYRIY